MFHTDIPTRTDGHTGPYIFRATLPGDRGEILGSTHALLEAYVPLRWEVKTTTAKKHFKPDENPALNVAARYLWDKPASELPVRAEA